MPNSSLTKLLWATKTQIFLAVLLSLLLILPHFEVIPTPEKLGVLISGYFKQAGAPVVALVSFIENIVGFNAYFPGSIVILTSMAMTGGDPPRAILIFFAIVIPAMAGQNVNYWIGRIVKGGVKAETERVAASHPANGQWKMWLWFLSTYWHPHLAALTSLACGAEKVRYTVYLKFFLVSSVAWNLFWGVAMYNFGQFVRVDRNLIMVFAIYLLAWFTWDVYRFYARPEEKESDFDSP